MSAKLKLGAVLAVATAVPMFFLARALSSSSERASRTILAPESQSTVVPARTSDAPMSDLVNESAALDGEGALRQAPQDSHGVSARMEQDDRSAFHEATSFYAQARSRYLSTFLSDSPDIDGWHSLLGIMAADAQLDPESITTGPNGLAGSFMIPGTSTSVSFAISEENAKIESCGAVALPGLSDAAYRSVVSFDLTKGDPQQAQGVVQLWPHEDLVYHEDGPIGCVYEVSDDNASFRPIAAEMREGMTWVNVPAEGSATSFPTAGLGWASPWMQRIREAQRRQSTQPK